MGAVIDLFTRKEIDCAELRPLSIESDYAEHVERIVVTEITNEYGQPAENVASDQATARALAQMFIKLSSP
jgi:hypothetical protein